MLKQYAQFIRQASYNSKPGKRKTQTGPVAIPKRLLTPKKYKKEVIVPDNIPKIFPLPNPPVFQSKNGYQLVAPYQKLQYSNVYKVNKKKPITILKFFETSFLGKNTEFFKRQIVDGQMWLLRANEDTPSKNKRDKKNQDYSSYDTIEGPEILELELQASDVIANYACIHELKVPDLANSENNLPFKNLDIVYEDKKLVVVNKPSGLPVHPSGMAYKFNSLLYLLTARENQLKGIETEVYGETAEFKHAVYPCHRIDKDTSGVVIFAKNHTTAVEMNKIIENKKFVMKKYLALVHGDFGTKIRISKHPVVEVDLGKRYENGGIGDKIVYGKSIFKPIHYDEKSNTTLLECQIFTGRRHQIRQHLRNIDVHIVNDPLYGIDGILKDPMHQFPSKGEFLNLRYKYEEKLDERNEHWDMESVCSNCSHVTYRDPKESRDGYMRLHSFEYVYQTDPNGEPDWYFKAAIPKWAKDILPADKIAELEKKSASIT